MWKTTCPLTTFFAPLSLSTMTDNEMRGIVLKAFYNRRRKNWIQWAAEEDKSDLPLEEEDLYRITNQLGEHELIDWKPVGRYGGLGKINAFGIDVVEGHATAPISIKIDQSKTYNVSSSHNVQIGDGNIQDVKISLEKLIGAINDSTAGEAEKAEAKSRLKKFLEHPLVSSIAGGLISTLKF